MQSIINRWMAQAIPFIPRALLQRASRRYVAGETAEDAVACVRHLAEAAPATRTLPASGHPRGPVARVRQECT